jgi:outer membrane beta-barrel protein
MRFSPLLMLLLLAPPVHAEEEEELLDDDGSVAAVQDRLFKLKHELSFGIGFLPLDAFYKGLSAQLGYTFHFSDHLSWQVGRGFFNYSLPTSLQKSLEAEWGATPSEFQRVEWAIGSELMFRPIYAKGTLLNQSLMWFELYLVGGASVFKMNNGFAPAVNLGGGFRVFQSQAVSFRIEAADHFVFAQKRTQVATFQLIMGLNFGGGR